MHLWFEVSFLTFMGTVSANYHLFYGWIAVWGPWLRKLDWMLALMVGPVMLSYFFMSKYSHLKMILNFWLLVIIIAAIDIFMAQPAAYVLVILLEFALLCATQKRSMKKIHKMVIVAVVFWVGLGVVLFFLSDLILYWYLHTVWHVSIFVGICLFLDFGPPQEPEKKYQEEEHTVVPQISLANAGWNSVSLPNGLNV